MKLNVAAIIFLANGVSGFAPTLMTQSPTSCRSCRTATNRLDEIDGENSDAETTSQDPIFSRRTAIATALSAVMATTLIAGSSSPAQAYSTSYPEELVSVDGGLDGRTRKREQVLEQEAERTAAVTLGPRYKPVSAALWGSALWLLSGSRSNPVATPLANLLYNPDKEKWLKDRNDGLFADLPIPFLGVLAIVFCAIGWGADNLLVLLADGDRNISLQLAGVSLISGASLELGRIASGEKALTRDEADRDGQLETEFLEFAQKRLAPGGNCHRSDVVAAFRRYFAKYRQADSEEYPLTDLEIERLLKSWARRYNPQVSMTSSGFFYGVQINKDADVLA